MDRLDALLCVGSLRGVKCQDFRIENRSQLWQLPYPFMLSSWGVAGDDLLDRLCDGDRPG